MFKLITLATLLIGTVNCYQETAFSNYQDAFSNYQEYFQEPIKPQNGLAIARQALGGLSSGGAALIGVAAAGTAAAVGTVQNANTNANLDASNRRIDSADTKAKATCTSMTTLLGIADPTMGSTSGNTGVSGSSSTAVRSSTTTSEVARHLDTLGSDSYALTKVLYGTGATATSAISAAKGLAQITTSMLTQLDKTTATIDNTALSIADFNTFRKNVAAAIRTLDDKIREILAVTPPTCS